MISSFQGTKPTIHKTAFVHGSAQVIGNVTLAENASVWCNAVIRGDYEFIRIGKNTNVQDCTVVHTCEKHPVIVGENVTIGHNATIHGCTIGNNCLIGIGSTILNGATIGDGCVIGAGAVVTEGATIPPGSLVLGVPGRVMNPVTTEHLAFIAENAREYVDLARKHEKKR